MRNETKRCFKIKDIILDLIKSFYSKKSIIRDIVVTEQKGVRSVNIFDNLAANKWELFTQDKVTPDIEKANKIIEEEKKTISLQLFRIANRVLESKTMMLEWKKAYGASMPKESDDADKLIDWAVGALDHTKVITFHEYEVQEPLFDEQGILLGNKMIPKKEDTLLEDAE